MATSLPQLLTQTFRPRILVIGDVMLDRYVWGDVDRISPEAPIPIFKVGKEEHRLGGAGSVSTMLAALDADVTLASIVGDDGEGKVTRAMLDQIGVDTGAVFTLPGRVSTLKERLLGRTHSRHPQQMMRIDREQSEAVDATTADRLLAAIERQLDRTDLVMISDYNKGVCAGEFIPRVIDMVKPHRLPVVADPVRDADYCRYHGCTCITPNRTEASLAVGMKIATPEDGLEAARRLLRFGIESVMVTLDRDGIAWADRQGNVRHFPIRPRQVYDITGAGDMVLSTLGYAMASGVAWHQIVELANLAGGLEVERLGVMPVTRRELAAAIRNGGYSPVQKVVSVDELRAALAPRRKQGERVAMTNGCFDLLHPGHVASLQEARNYGDLLVVGLNSDRSIRELKGPGRPIVDERGRAEMLAALACVDYVVLFDETSVAGLIGQVLPDVLVKSAQYAHDEVVGHEIVEAAGGRVVRVPMRGDYSTTALLRHAAATTDDSGCTLPLDPSHHDTLRAFPAQSSPASGDLRKRA
jgi:D-beta-D-heptose 7-phosphate kinase/D-beta-D-heptose 1-phosphate adenosyltransferase